MTRGLAVILANALASHAGSKGYPTRSVEYMLAWLIVVYAAVLPIPHTAVPETLRTIFEVAPIWFVSTGGIVVGFLRIIALIRNGSWTPSPWWRMAGAAAGFNFWLAIGGLYLIGIIHGKAILPLQAEIPVYMFFEGYSCFRCGQDARRTSKQSARLTDRVGNG